MGMGRLSWAVEQSSGAESTAEMMDGVLILALVDQEPWELQTEM